MKKIDKLILSSFLGPFFLTFLVVVFILLTQHMLKYFDDIVGKDLGMDVLAELLFYFAVFMTPIAIPLAVLLSSLMTFGNLGEHFELTAIKSAGISLLRALLPIFGFVLILTVVAFYSNNYFVPKAALEAYSLLYDIKKKKPALDLKPGAFYNGIPDFSMKVENKLEDGVSIEDIIIYDHRGITGNKKITLADSGAMYTINNDRYLKLELYDGNFYFEDYNETASQKQAKATMSRSSFSKTEYILDLSSFGMDRTDKSLFEGNRIMRNLNQLGNDVDSVQSSILDAKVKLFQIPTSTFYYHLKNDTVQLPDYLFDYKAQRDTLTLENQSITKASDNQAPLPLLAKEEEREKKVSKKEPLDTNDKVISERKKRVKNAQKKKKKSFVKNQKLKSELLDNSDLSINNITTLPKKEIKKPQNINDTLSHEEIIKYVEEDSAKALIALQTTLNNVRQAKAKIQAHNSNLERMRYDKNVFDIQYHKILANSFACIIMFLIGAPLGAIIKKGGLGIPVLMSIIFFIIYYVFTMTGEKWAKQDYIDPMIGLWSANILLLPIGLFFLRQARNDARLFEADFYNVVFDKFKNWTKRNKIAKQ